MVCFAGIIDFNFLCFRNAIQQVFELRNQAQPPPEKIPIESPTTNGVDNNLSPTLTDEPPVG